MDFNIRKYHPSDICDIYDICLKTGNDGKDATPLMKDKQLKGHFYAAPYVMLEPESAFVLTLNGLPVGYIIGTTDSSNFRIRTEKEWFPILREKYKNNNFDKDSRDARLVNLINNGYILKKEFIDFPAHLHVDILPAGQGKGFGKILMETFMNYLKENKVSGLHLEVSTSNSGAVKFYEKLGFEKLVEYEYSIGYGIKF